MIGLPQPGESVTFRIAEGHRVPIAGRPGKFYELGKDFTEAWSQALYARLRTGAIEIVRGQHGPARDSHDHQ